jgi:hypothetical protein
MDKAVMRFQMKESRMGSSPYLEAWSEIGRDGEVSPDWAMLRITGQLLGQYADLLTGDKTIEVTVRVVPDLIG